MALLEGDNSDWAKERIGRRTKDQSEVWERKFMQVIRKGLITYSSKERTERRRGLECYGPISLLFLL